MVKPMSATINSTHLRRSLQGRNHHVNLVCQILFGLGASTHVGGMGRDPSWWIWTSWRSCYGSVKIIKPHFVLGETTAIGNSSQTWGLEMEPQNLSKNYCIRITILWGSSGLETPKTHIWHCSHSFIVFPSSQLSFFPSSLSHPMSLHFLFPSLHKINMKHIGKSLVSQTGLASCHPRSQSSTITDNHKNPCRKEYSNPHIVLHIFFWLCYCTYNFHPSTIPYSNIATANPLYKWRLSCNNSRHSHIFQPPFILYVPLKESRDTIVQGTELCTKICKCFSAWQDIAGRRWGDDRDSVFFS